MRTVLLTIAIATLFSAQRASAIDFNMAPLEFSNRARCAELSQKPARSAFLLIDAFNAGKAGYAQGLLAQKVNPAEDPRQWAKKSVTQFRLWTTHLAVDILNLMLQGKLPLLPVDATSPPAYRRAVESCVSRNDTVSCAAMNDFLAELWARAHMPNPSWKELGLEQALAPADLKEKTAIGCHIVRKFSALHSQLRSQTTEGTVVENIAFDSFKPEDHLDSCFNPEDSDDPRFTTVQLDIADIDPAKEQVWDDHGYQFWHTFKLFLSWGWRHAPDYRAEYGKFRQLFPSLAFEDSVMLIPNGCRTIELPRCDATGMAADSMRAAKFLGQTHAAVTEVPAKPIDMLFQGRFQRVNDDVMGVFKADNADAWARDFKDKLSGLRFEMVTKLNTSLAKLQVVTKLVDTSMLARDVQALLDDRNLDKNEVFLACMEYTIAKNKLFQDINNEIQALSTTQELSSVLLADTSKELAQYVAYYNRAQATMQSFCETLEKRQELTNQTPDLLKSLNEWAFYIMRPTERSSYDGQCAKNPANPACPQNQSKRYLVSTRRLPTGASEEVVICHTPLECARTVLSSLVSVVSVRRYARAFLPLRDTLESPAVFNPYAMPTACKLYDPFLIKRQAWKMFVSDLAWSLLYGASCGTFKFHVLQPSFDKPASYKEIFEQNQTSYDIQMKTEPTKYMLGFDLQFLAGISCGITAANTIYTHGRSNRPDWYGNLMIGTCKGDSKTEYKVKVVTLKPEDNATTDVDNTTIQRCFGCQIGISNIPATLCAVPPVGQVVGVGVGIFQGVLRLFSNLSDPDNIPHGTNLEVDLISKTFEDANGKVSKRCHNRLAEGLTCSSPK